MSTSTEVIQDLASREYKYGFFTDVEQEAIPRGLSEEIVRLISSKKNEPVIYQTQETSLKDRLLNDFRAAKGLKAKLAIANELAKSFEDFNAEAWANHLGGECLGKAISKIKIPARHSHGQALPGR